MLHLYYKFSLLTYLTFNQIKHLIYTQLTSIQMPILFSIIVKTEENREIHVTSTPVGYTFIN